MLRLKRAIGVCILGSTLVSAGAVHAVTYYVATTGSDSNKGTSETTPFLTIQKAVSTMVAGDTTYVRGGLYMGQGVQFRRSGTASAPIKLLNYPGESPIYQCMSNLTADGQMFSIRHGSGSRFAIGWITIEGFEVRKCSRALKFYNLHDTIIRRNWFHDMWNTPIQGSGARVLIDRNIIANSGTQDEPAHGIYANGSAFTITNNIIYGATYYGIQQNGSASAVYKSEIHAGPEFSHSVDWIIANNVIAYNGTARGGGMVVWGGLCSRTRIENNIFYENAANSANSVAQSIHFQSPGSVRNVEIRNNFSFASGTGGTGGLGFIGGGVEHVHYTQSGNIVNTANPAFVNAPAAPPDSPNFALTERSPAIDAGLSLAETKTAFDGTPRPQGRAYDIGAYEYKAGSDSIAPDKVENVQIR